jgi:hypothetical protein
VKAEPTFYFRQPALSAELIIAGDSVAALGVARRFDARAAQRILLSLPETSV